MSKEYKDDGTIRTLKGPDYAYLGKFRKEKFLNEGHNTNKTSRILGAASQGAMNIAGSIIMANQLGDGEDPTEELVEDTPVDDYAAPVPTVTLTGRAKVPLRKKYKLTDEKI